MQSLKHMAVARSQARPCGHVRVLSHPHAAEGNKVGFRGSRRAHAALEVAVPPHDPLSLQNEPAHEPTRLVHGWHAWECASHEGVRPPQGLVAQSAHLSPEQIVLPVHAVHAQPWLAQLAPPPPHVAHALPALPQALTWSPGVQLPLLQHP